MKADITERTEYYAPDKVFDRVFGADIKKGEQMYWDGVKNRPSSGIDLKDYINGGGTLRFVDPGKTGGSFFDGFGDFIGGTIDAAGRSFDYYGDMFERIYDAGSNAVIDYGKSFLPDGGYTFAIGGTASADAGIGGAIATGDFYSIDFERGQVSFGEYNSGQAGATIGIPGTDVGFEYSFFDTNDFKGALSGPFNATGGQVAFGPSATIEKITNIPSPGNKVISGTQITFGLGTPTAEVHTQFGAGGIYNDTTLDFGQIPQYLYDKVMGRK